MNTAVESGIKPARNTNLAGENGLGTPNLRTQPLREEISARAKELWEGYGRPSGRDDEIWLEAERQLLGADPEVADAGGAVLKTDLQATVPVRTSTPEGDESRGRTKESTTSRMQSSTIEPGGRSRPSRKVR